MLKSALAQDIIVPSLGEHTAGYQSEQRVDCQLADELAVNAPPSYARSQGCSAVYSGCVHQSSGFAVLWKTHHAVANGVLSWAIHDSINKDPDFVQTADVLSAIKTVRDLNSLTFIKLHKSGRTFCCDPGTRDSDTLVRAASQGYEDTRTICRDRLSRIECLKMSHRRLSLSQGRQPVRGYLRSQYTSGSGFTALHLFTYLSRMRFYVCLGRLASTLQEASIIFTRQTIGRDKDDISLAERRTPSAARPLESDAAPSATARSSSASSEALAPHVLHSGHFFHIPYPCRWLEFTYAATLPSFARLRHNNSAQMAAIPPPVNTPWSARRREDRQAQEMMSPTRDCSEGQALERPDDRTHKQARSSEMQAPTYRLEGSRQNVRLSSQWSEAPELTFPRVQSPW
ncbi:uncharacterized protein B0H18DRAFT_954916 [Fomitopsis serialis]|uniref:uncharacterized protein n=1 Tax=Fomitopsis serialis TaxID=139415 RepID=UPI0020079C4C|nr:uncharacterized protein B0H18DRAFT_954916 [Neoantrodia serialis]KAH9926039.1 hypothetical protein B0H18DRAFT_954916 [Neoantrodia serialis]